jgi:hypothetical protein
MHPVIRAILQSGSAWDGYFYDLGDEKTIVTGGWVVGSSQTQSGASGTQSKEIDHLKLYTASTNVNNAWRTYVTELPINLTDISLLKIDWEIAVTGTVTNQARFGVGTVKTDDSFAAQIIHTDSSVARGIETLDVSSLTGNYYIKLWGFAAGAGRNCTVKGYKIWSE